MKKIILLIACALFSTQLLALEDKIAVSIDDKVITEKDILDRYFLIKGMQKNKEFPDYHEDIRVQILEQLIDDAVMSLYWEKHANKIDLVTDFELQVTKKKYNLLEDQHRALADYLRSQKQRQVLQKELFAKNLIFNRQEKEQFFKENFSYFPLEIIANFKLGYSACYGSNSAEAKNNAKDFENVPLNRWPNFFIEEKRWQEQGVWHQFEDNEECIALRIDSVKCPSLLDYRYEVSVVHFQGKKSVSKREVIEYEETLKLPAGVVEATKESYSIIDRKDLPSQLNSGFAKVGDFFPLYEQEEQSGYLYIKNITPTSSEALEELVLSYAEQMLIQENVQQSFDLWLQKERQYYLIEKPVRR